MLLHNRVLGILGLLALLLAGCGQGSTAEPRFPAEESASLGERFDQPSPLPEQGEEESREDSGPDRNRKTSTKFNLGELYDQWQAEQAWVPGFDRDNCGGLCWAGDRCYIYVLDQERFLASPSMEEAGELGIRVELLQAVYTLDQLEEALAKLWDIWDHNGLAVACVDTYTNTLVVDVRDISEKNIQQIMDYCGITGIQFNYVTEGENPTT